MQPNENESIGKWISILHRNAFIYFNAQFKDLGINGAHIRTLKYIYKHPGIRQEDLSSQFQKDKATIARSIKKLEKVGLVQRQKDPQDKRAYNLYPTEKALTHYETIHEVITNWSALLTQGFTEDERNQLLYYLKRMAENVHDQEHAHCHAPRCTHE